MSLRQSLRRQQILKRAEGYLELATGGRWNVPRPVQQSMIDRTFACLDRLDKPGQRNIQALYLRGRALAAMDRFAEAIIPLSHAAKLDPEDIFSRLALGWCYKRMHRLDLGIQALEDALRSEPFEPLLHYNLACYWSLADRAAIALKHLGQALDLDPELRDKVSDEPDFDPIRQHPEFQALTSALA